MTQSMRRSLHVLVALIGCLCAFELVLAQSAPQPILPTQRLTAGFHVITAELATTPLSRMTGMMFRTSTPPNHGMLFVFEDKAQHCFWMRNTPLPLTIAFIEDDGTIVQLDDMAPKVEASHCPQRAIRYALEMEQGWFKKRAIGVGSKIGGLPTAR